MADARFPLPSPLPPLPAAFSRRAALFGAVTATGFLGTAAATTAPAPAVAAPPMPPEAFAALWAERRHVCARIDATPDDVGEDDALVARLRAMDGRALSIPVTTPKGAVAALEWAWAEFVEFYADGSDGDRVVLALLGGALGVLRQQLDGVAA